METQRGSEGGGTCVHRDDILSHLTKDVPPPYGGASCQSQPGKPVCFGFYRALAPRKRFEPNKASAGSRPASGTGEDGRAERTQPT